MGKRIKVPVGVSKWPITSEYKQALRTSTGILRCSKGAVVYKGGLYSTLYGKHNFKLMQVLEAHIVQVTFHSLHSAFWYILLKQIFVMNPRH